mgnify:CR=1 FL=1
MSFDTRLPAFCTPCGKNLSPRSSNPLESVFPSLKNYELLGNVNPLNVSICETSPIDPSLSAQN